jgi:hypothetical protein
MNYVNIATALSSVPDLAPSVATPSDIEPKALVNIADISRWEEEN